MTSPSTGSSSMRRGTGRCRSCGARCTWTCARRSPSSSTSRTSQASRSRTCPSSRRSRPGTPSWPPRCCAAISSPSRSGFPAPVCSRARQADDVGVAVLCDIHGNLPALEAVIQELGTDEPDAVVIGGDVAAGPMPLEVLGRLRELPWPVLWLRGNADRALVMSYDGTVPEQWRDHPIWIADAWTATQISHADRDFLDALPPLLRACVPGVGDVLFCHGTPESDEERVTVFTPESRLEQILAGTGAAVVVAGHTHR